MRIAICDDDIAEQEQIEKALQGWDPTRTAEKFLNGAALLDAAKRLPRFDIVFLDIYLPGENGIDIAKALQNASPETGIAFVTTSTEFAVDAFSLHALHYLVKPVSTDGIIETFRRLNELRSKRRRQLSFTVGHDRHTVFMDQICLLENDNHAVNVSLSDGRRLKVWTSFAELEQKLDGSFLKINRGIVVNMEYIVRMGTDTCTMRDGVKLPIAIRHSASIRAMYDNYVFDRLSQQRGVRGDKG